MQRDRIFHIHSIATLLGCLGLLLTMAGCASEIPDPEESPLDILALDEALTGLARIDAVKAELVKLRFFAGLNLEEAGNALGLSPATADRYWAYAKARLYRELADR
jgi:DNA-directed RNA polymerase specialized sigma24 family protein